MVLWFKAKSYGYGWYPVKWQGWLIMVAYVLLILAGLPIAGQYPYRFVAHVVILTLILIGICKKKGEKPAWRWGDLDDKV